MFSIHCPLYLVKFSKVNGFTDLTGASSVLRLPLSFLFSLSYFPIPLPSFWPLGIRPFSISDPRFFP